MTNNDSDVYNKLTLEDLFNMDVLSFVKSNNQNIILAIKNRAEKIFRFIFDCKKTNLTKNAFICMMEPRLRETYVCLSDTSFFDEYFYQFFNGISIKFLDITKASYLVTLLRQCMIFYPNRFLDKIHHLFKLVNFIELPFVMYTYEMLLNENKISPHIVDRILESELIGESLKELSFFPDDLSSTNTFSGTILKIIGIYKLLSLFSILPDIRSVVITSINFEIILKRFVNASPSVLNAQFDCVKSLIDSETVVLLECYIPYFLELLEFRNKTFHPYHESILKIFQIMFYSPNVLAYLSNIGNIFLNMLSIFPKNTKVHSSIIDFIINNLHEIEFMKNIVSIMIPVFNQYLHGDSFILRSIAYRFHERIITEDTSGFREVYDEITKNYKFYLEKCEEYMKITSEGYGGEDETVLILQQFKDLNLTGEQLVAILKEVNF